MGKKWTPEEYQLLILLNKEYDDPETMAHFFSRNAEVDKKINPRSAKAIERAIANMEHGFITTQTNQEWTREQQLFILGLKNRGATYEQIGGEFQKVFHFTRTIGSMSGMVSKLRNDPDTLKEANQQPTVLDAWNHIQEENPTPRGNQKPRNGMPRMPTQEDIHEHTMAMITLNATMNKLIDIIATPTYNQKRKQYNVHPIMEGILKEAGLMQVSEGEGEANGKTK